MSKIHQALRKAEQDKAAKRDILPFPNAEKGPGDTYGSVNKPFLDECLVSFLDPESIAAEQYKKLRTRILQFADVAPKTILVTSAVSQEGKSLTAANLAITIAHGIDEHVLLVDGDLRQPSINALFGLESTYGLTDYLKGEIDLPKIFRETGIPKLKVLPAGSPSDKPSELLASKKMMSLTRELRSRYDDRYIIIDSSPVTLTDEPDILAKQVDGIIMVVRAGKTPREFIEKALNVLNGGNILGIVFNHLEYTINKANNTYYGYYQYGHK